MGWLPCTAGFRGKVLYCINFKRGLAKIGEKYIIGYIKPREEKKMKKFLEEFKEFFAW